MHSKRTNFGQYTLDWVGYLVLLFEDITNLELERNVSCTSFKRYHLEITSQKIRG